jgi:hypothetical protein
MSLVRYRNNDYSVPTRYGHQEVLAKGYVDRVEIVCRGETVTVHARSYDKAEFIFNPLHYLALLEHKSKALDQAAPLDDWRLADCVYRLRRLIEARMGRAPRVHPGAAADGGLPSTSRRIGHRGGAASWRNQF